MGYRCSILDLGPSYLGNKSLSVGYLDPLGILSLFEHAAERGRLRIGQPKPGLLSRNLI